MPAPLTPADLQALPLFAQISAPQAEALLAVAAEEVTGTVVAEGALATAGEMVDWGRRLELTGAPEGSRPGTQLR